MDASARQGIIEDVLDPATRPLKERWLGRVAASPLGAAPPVAFTAAGLALGLAAAGAAWRGPAWLAVALWLVSRLADGLDGVVARVRNDASPLGGYLDLMADFTVYATVPLGLAARDGDAAGYLAAAGLLGAFYLNAASWMYLAALAGEATTAGETPLTSIPMPTALIEGAETIAAYALFLAWPSGAVPVGFWVLAGLVMVGVGQRLLLAVRTLGARR